MENNDEIYQSEKVIAFVKALKARGVISDLKIKDKNVRAAKKQLHANAYHNTLNLLRQYRTVVWMLECFPDTIAEELEVPLGDLDKLIEKLDVEVSYGNRKLENRLASIEKTRMMIDRVNDALTVLKKKPEEGERLYELIYLTYIGPENLTHFDLLYRLNLSSRHYYRLKDQAIKLLSMRLWSTDDKNLGFWLEALALIEQISM